MFPASKRLINRVREASYNFASNRLYAISTWGSLAARFAAYTSAALIRLPIYGLFNPASMNWPTRMFENVLSFSTRLIAIPAYIIGSVAGIVLGGIFGFKASRRGEKSDTALFLANYLNDHFTRLAVVRTGLVASLAAGLVVGLLGLTSAAVTGPVLPIMLTAGAIGTAIGGIRGVAHKWSVDGINATYADISDEAIRFGESRALLEIVLMRANQLREEALTGHPYALERLRTFSVPDSMQFLISERDRGQDTARLTAEISGAYRHLTQINERMDATVQTFDQAITSRSAQQSSIDALSERIDRLAATSAKTVLLTDRLSKLNEANRNGLAQFNRSFYQVIDGWTVGMAQTKSELTALLNTLEGTMKTLAVDISRLGQDQSATKAELSDSFKDLEAKMKCIAADLAGFHKKELSLHDATTGHAKRLSDDLNEVSRLVSANASAIEKCLVESKKQSGALSTLEQDTATHRQVFEQRLDDVQKELSEGKSMAAAAHELARARPEPRVISYAEAMTLRLKDPQAAAAASHVRAQQSAARKRFGY